MVSVTMDEVEAAQKILPPIKSWPLGTLLSLALSYGCQGPVARDIFYFSVGSHCFHGYDRAPHTGLLHALIIVKKSGVLFYWLPLLCRGQACAGLHRVPKFSHGGQIQAGPWESEPSSSPYQLPIQSQISSIWTLFLPSY